MNFIPLYRRPASDPDAKACLSCGMRSIALFGVLDENALESVHHQIQQLSLEADQPLMLAGRAEAAVFTLRKGIVRFERASPGGERRILRLAGCGDLLGQELLLQRPLLDDVLACTPVEVCRIPVSLVLELGAQYPALMRELMERWQRALEDSQTWLADLSAGPARRRVLNLLAKLVLYSGEGQPVWLPRREEMGAMLSLTVETTSRQISQLRREGILQSRTRRYTTIDALALQRALSQAEVTG